MAKRKKDAGANSDIQIFCYKAMPVRTVDIDGETWFVAKDVADILEIRDAFNATRDLEEDEKGTYKVSTPGGIQDMTVINEIGLYNLIFKSKKNEAKQFRRWITHDVIPSIRKTGSYTAPNVQKKPEKKYQISGGWVKTVSKIIDMAFAAKSDEDFQKVLALDMAFTKEAGYSALEAAGLYIVPEPITHLEDDFNVVRFTCVFRYKLKLDKAITLPESLYKEHFLDENGNEIK